MLREAAESNTTDRLRENDCDCNTKRNQKLLCNHYFKVWPKNSVKNQKSYKATSRLEVLDSAGQVVKKSQ